MSSPISSSASSSRLAVFLDIENICGYRSAFGLDVDLTAVMTRLATIAPPIIKRSYGSIFSLPQPQFSQQNVLHNLQINQIQHEEVFHLKGAKNSADLRIAVAVLTLAHERPDITHFAMLSNDRDFTPVLNYLREMGKIIIGVGPTESRVNALYRQCCDIFLFHDEIQSQKLVPIASNFARSATPQIAATLDMPKSAIDKGGTASTKAAQQHMLATNLAKLQAAIRSVQVNGEESTGSRVSQRMRCLFPDFVLEKGAFKSFCLGLVASGGIKLIQHTSADFVIKIVEKPGRTITSKPKAEPTLDPVSIAETSEQKAAPQQSSQATPRLLPLAPASAPSLLNQYESLIRSKMAMHVPMPTFSERSLIYATMLQVLATGKEEAPIIPLQTLVKQVGILLPGLEAAAQWLLFRLFLCNVFLFAPVSSPNPRNPTVTGIAVHPQRIDQYFVLSMLDFFRKNKQDLPFDSATLSMLLFGDTSASWEIDALEKVHKMAKCAVDGD